MEEKPEYVTDALAMLGKGYEIHPPSNVIQEGDDGLPEERTDEAWIKLSTSFLRTIKKMRGAKLSVWLAIALRINENYTSFPSINVIMKDTGLSNREVIDSYKELEEMGYLKIRRKGKHNVYFVTMFAAFGHSDPMNSSSEVSSPVKFSEKPVKSENVLAVKTSLKQEEEDVNNTSSPLKKEKKDPLDGIIKYELHPMSIQNAIAEFFKLTPNWGAKYNKQFMEWAVGANVVREQIEVAANLWRSDKRFNWQVPTLKGIQEHWLELTTAEVLPERPEYKKFVAPEKEYVPVPHRVPNFQASK